MKNKFVTTSFKMAGIYLWKNSLFSPLSPHCLPLHFLAVTANGRLMPFFFLSNKYCKYIFFNCTLSSLAMDWYKMFYYKLTVTQVYLVRNISHFLCFHIERQKIATIKHHTYKWDLSNGKATPKVNSVCLITTETGRCHTASMYKIINTPLFVKIDHTKEKIPSTSNKCLFLSVQPKCKVIVYSKTKSE